MATFTAPQPRYALPDGPHLAAVEALFIDGQEAWTQRAISRLDPRFLQSPTGRAELVLTCRRLETAFRKVCAGGLGPDAVAGAGLAADEFSTWARYGEAYAAAREPAFRVLVARAATGLAPASASAPVAVPATASWSIQPANRRWYEAIHVPGR